MNELDAVLKSRVPQAFQGFAERGVFFAWWPARLRKSDELPSLPIILDAIERSKASTKWQRKNDRFVSSMSIWLPGHCSLE
ncbi:MAG: hypothetical protein LBR31_01215 [Desulfovibrio sp.]|jgi:hypothetical protein|nr:hypothetical protein [Desulfovibrio sp.]